MLLAKKQGRIAQWDRLSTGSLLPNQPSKVEATFVSVTKNQHTIVIHYHQDFFQVMTYRSLIYWPNHSGETWLSKKGKGDD